MSMFHLAISLSHNNYLPWIHGPNNLQVSHVLTASEFTFSTRRSTAEHHFCCFIFLVVIASLCSSPSRTLDTFQPGGCIFQCQHSLLFTHLLFWQKYWRRMLSLQGTVICQNSSSTCLSWVALHGMVITCLSHAPLPQDSL